MASLYKKTRPKVDPNTGRKTKIKSAKWWIKYRDAEGIVRRVPGFTDKSATQQHAASLEREAELGRAGVRDPHKEHRKRPLSEHLSDFERHLRDKGDTETQVKLVMGRDRKIVAGCGFKFISDLSPSRVLGFLADLRSQGIAAQTSNHYLRAIKQFARWLVLDRRHNDNVLAHLSTMNVEADRRRIRRPLTPAEFERLIGSALSGPVLRKMGGRDRAMLYIVAAYTGYRVSEICSVTPRSFDLETDPPTLKVQAGYSKRRRWDVVPLRSDFAKGFKEWFASKGQLDPDSPLFPMAKNTTAFLIRSDLERVGIPYVDANGQYADFHALRKTFITNLARSGVFPKAAQTLARHSSMELTMNTYTQLGLQELAGDVEALPPVPVAGPARPDGQGRLTAGAEGQAVVPCGAQIGALHPTSGVSEVASVGIPESIEGSQAQQEHLGSNPLLPGTFGTPGPQLASAGNGGEYGGGGIRTHGRFEPTAVFKTAPIDHSGTPPSVGSPARVGLYWPTSSMMSSATKIGTSTVTATAIASLGRESTSTVSPS
jgi:integrase